MRLRDSLAEFSVATPGAELESVSINFEIGLAMTKEKVDVESGSF
jgi:hypothetical protein